MLNFTIYTADCVGNSGNCLYPNKMIVTDKESFIKAIIIGSWDTQKTRMDISSLMKSRLW